MASSRRRRRSPANDSFRYLNAQCRPGPLLTEVALHGHFTRTSATSWSQYFTKAWARALADLTGRPSGRLRGGACACQTSAANGTRWMLARTSSRRARGRGGCTPRRTYAWRRRGGWWPRRRRRGPQLELDEVHQALGVGLGLMAVIESSERSAASVDATRGAGWLMAPLRYAPM